MTESRSGRRRLALQSATCLLVMANMATVAWADRPSRPYLVRAGSEYQRACFEPCRCNIDRRDRLDGGFVLTRSLPAPDATSFALSNVRLVAPTWGEVHAGRGTYERSGVDGAQASSMELDLQWDDVLADHWDSGITRPPVGLGGAWPVISVTLTRNEFQCHDTVFGLVASRVADWDVTGELSIGDVFAFLSDYFAAAADVNGDGVTNVSDVFEFLADYLNP